MDDELYAAARALGEVLRQADAVQIYLRARADCEADAALVAQEAHVQAVYEELVARQRAGEDLPREEVERFYALRQRVQSAPRIRARDTALTDVKRLFVEAGTAITNQLGVDFTELALATPEA